MIIIFGCLCGVCVNNNNGNNNSSSSISLDDTHMHVSHTEKLKNRFSPSLVFGFSSKNSTLEMLCKDDKRVTVKINRHNFKKKRWSRDEDHKKCFKCESSFNLFRRRHQYVVF